MYIAYSGFMILLLRALRVRVPLTNLKVYVCKVFYFDKFWRPNETVGSNLSDIYSI